jgi:hypothetical protein
MSGPSSAPADSAFASRAKKRFTVEQANQSLPLVRRIATDIVRSHADVIAIQNRVGRLVGTEQSAAQKELEKQIDRLEDYVDELREVGCELKDYAMGLVDFLGRHQGRDVCLCWKLGEERIGYWHELNAGFAGRQPISTIRE